MYWKTLQMSNHLELYYLNTKILDTAPEIQ